MIKILIVDDSDTEIKILNTIFGSVEDFKVVGYAKNGKEAVKLTNLLKPDVITMDITMPVMNGIEATHHIMCQYPTPIVIITSKTSEDLLNATFEALEAGAVSVLEKPSQINANTFKNEYQLIVDTVRSMAEIKVIKRRFHTKHSKLVICPTPSSIKSTVNTYEIIGIGASVGGPQALHTVLGNLPLHFPIPIVVVQHMTAGFISGFSKWLNNNAMLTIKNAENNEILRAGNVYIAPDNHHLQVQRVNGNLIAKLVITPPISGFRPSVTVLFQSIAKVCGKNSIGILLTGMGSDGAQGLLELKHADAHTLIQDKKSAIVFGMAGIAQSLGAVDKVIELNQITDYLIKITHFLINKNE